MARAERTQNVGPGLDWPMVEQPTFKWEAEDKYNELKNFTLEINNIFKPYSMPQAEQIAIYNRWNKKDVAQWKVSL